MSDQPSKKYRTDIDCEKGRRLGCRSFCCRMLVRLKSHEMEPGVDGFAAKGFLDKTLDGNCIHFDLENGLCDRWETRPETCQEYMCNGDPNLQIVMRYGITNLVEVARRAATEYIPREEFIEIPYLSESD